MQEGREPTPNEAELNLIHEVYDGLRAALMIDIYKGKRLSLWSRVALESQCLPGALAAAKTSGADDFTPQLECFQYTSFHLSFPTACNSGMGSKSSKVAKSATSNAARRQYPSRIPSSPASVKQSSASTSSARDAAIPGPTVYPAPYTSENKNEGDFTVQNIYVPSFGDHG